MARSNPPVFCDDLMSEIFLRLPVKYLLRCQCVSKAWFSLISNPNFVKSHLRRSIQSFETNQTLIVKNFTQNEVFLTQNQVKDSSISLLSIDSRQIVADLKFPYSQGEFVSVPDYILAGSANGIVCVYVNCPETPHDHNWLRSPFVKRTTYTYLWNPATRKSKVLPSGSVCHDIYKGTLGFGFDPIDNDFKVVRVGANIFSAEVYSVNRNAWRQLPKAMDIPYGDAFDVCVNGFLCNTGLHGMMVFDLNKEAMNYAIKFPFSMFGSRIIEFDHSIAVIGLRDHRSSNKIDMWKLDDEACLCGGVEASWTMMFSVHSDLIVDSVRGYFRSGGILLMTDDGEWCLYDSHKKEARIVPVLIENNQIFKYTESLVSVPGFKQVNWNAREHDY